MVKKVTTSQTTEHTRTFVKCLDILRQRHSGFNSFEDFLTVSAISISNAVNFNDNREKEYLRIVNKYNEKERALFPQMLACVINEMSQSQKSQNRKQYEKTHTPRYYDVLGELFGGLEFHDAWKGQFFTPQPVSDFMGLLTIGNSEDAIKKRGYVSMLEPCIGGGANVIGAVNAMFQRGYNPCKELLVIGYDLDPRCIHMAYIQLSLMGVPAMLQQRNSLTNETFSDYWYTPIFILDNWADRLRLEGLIETLKVFANGNSKKVPAPEKIKPAKVAARDDTLQLTLF